MYRIDDKLREVKANMKERERLLGLFKKVEKQIREAERRKSELHQQLKKENLDVEKLEGLSVANIIYTISGRKLEKIEKEKQEALVAKLKYDVAYEELKDLLEEILRLRKRINEFGDLDYEYKELIKEKEKMLSSTSQSIADELNKIIDRQSNIISERKEIKEAIEAGKDLKYSLNNANRSLDSAKNWGVWDMLGGGMISTMAKHSRIDEARNEINSVQVLAKRFHRELQDIGQTININIDISSFLTFADYFFDGIFVDWAVQSRINDASDKVSDAIYKVENILSKLEREYVEIIDEYESLEKERLDIIERG